MFTPEELDAALLEAHLVRARHDGVHLVHSYVAVMELCRELRSQGSWGPPLDKMFDEAWAKVRFISRHGYAPKTEFAQKVRTPLSAAAEPLAAA